MIPDDDLPECCGSGCTNCVLDRTTRFRKPSTARPSVLDGGYKRFQCTNISQCSYNTFLFRFRYLFASSETIPPDIELSIPPGSHLMLRAPKGWRETSRPLNAIFATCRNKTAASMNELESRVHNGGVRQTVAKYDQSERDLYISRSYTPVLVDEDACEFEVLIKMEVSGEMSEYLQTVQVDDVLEWKGTYTGFVWERNARKSLICFAQGVGLAPIYSILTAILNDEEDETRLNLIYCCRDIDGILLRDKLTKMSAFWNFYSTIYLSRETCTCGGKTTRNCSCLSSKVKYGEKILNHRLEKIDIENLLHKYGQHNSLQVLICGTESFSKLIENCLTLLNVRDLYKF